MWFRLLLGSVDLHCFVGKQGKLYWRLIDVAQYLGRKNTYQFARRYGQNKAIQVLPEGFFYPHFDTICHVGSCRYVYTLLKTVDVNKSTAFRNVYTGQAFGHVEEQGHSDYNVTRKNSPRLVVNPEGEGDRLLTWIEGYVDRVELVRSSNTPMPSEDEDDKSTIKIEEDESSQAPQDDDDDDIVELPNYMDEASFQHLPQPNENMGTVYAPVPHTRLRIMEEEWLIQMLPGEYTLPQKIRIMVGEEPNTYARR